MHFLCDGGFLGGISGLGQAFCAQQPVLLMVSRKEDLAGGSLSPSRQLHWGVSALPVQLRAPCPGFCAVLSSDCLCCFPSGAAALPYSAIPRGPHRLLSLLSG